MIVEKKGKKVQICVLYTIQRIMFTWFAKRVEKMGTRVPTRICFAQYRSR